MAVRDYLNRDIVATALIEPKANDSFYNPVSKGHTGFAADGTYYVSGVQQTPIVYASWYSETANTYRGLLQTFPTSGLILLSPSELTILDETVSTLDLWIRFLLSDGFALTNNFSGALQGFSPSGLCYADGVISVTYAPDAGTETVDRTTIMVVHLDFTQDKAYMDLATLQSGQYLVFNPPAHGYDVKPRATGGVWVLDKTAATLYGISNGTQDVTIDLTAVGVSMNFSNPTLYYWLDAGDGNLYFFTGNDGTTNYCGLKKFSLQSNSVVASYGTPTTWVPTDAGLLWAPQNHVVYGYNGGLYLAGMLNRSFGYVFNLTDMQPHGYLPFDAARGLPESTIGGGAGYVVRSANGNLLFCGASTSAAHGMFILEWNPTAGVGLFAANDEYSLGTDPATRIDGTPGNVGDNVLNGIIVHEIGNTTPDVLPQQFVFIPEDNTLVGFFQDVPNSSFRFIKVTTDTWQVSLDVAKTATFSWGQDSALNISTLSNSATIGSANGKLLCWRAEEGNSTTIIRVDAVTLQDIDTIPVTQTMLNNGEAVPNQTGSGDILSFYYDIVAQNLYVNFWTGNYSDGSPTYVMPLQS